MLTKILASLVLVTLGFQQGTLTERFNSPEGKFNILMPSKPTLEDMDVDTPVGKVKAHMYYASNNTGYFAASYGDYPVTANVDEIDSVLDGVRDGVLSGSKAELLTEKKISLHSYPGTRVHHKESSGRGRDHFHLANLPCRPPPLPTRGRNDPEELSLSRHSEVSHLVRAS